MDTRLITLDLPEPLLARLEDAAHRRSVSVGSLLREVLARELGPLPPRPTHPPRRRVLAWPAPRDPDGPDDLHETDDFDVIDRSDTPPPAARI